MRLLPDRLRRLVLQHGGRSGDRGSAEIGVALVAAAVVAGSLLGSGVARTAVEVTDGVTWLADPPTGQVVEINPATLEPQASALVGLPGEDLVLAQDRGRLIVSNRSTGALTSIDLATLLASGRRDGATGEAVTVLLEGGRAFLVDRQSGLVANLDPVTLATRGRVWLAAEGLRDATVDGAGGIWVAAGDDSLSRLSWSDASLTFTAEAVHRLSRIGDEVRLVAHDEGVTAVSPSTGAIIQVGTGHDMVSAAPRMRGEISPAKTSASTLVPVSVPGEGVVVIVSDAARVTEVDTAASGCPAPGVPVELGGVVYVPCTTTGRVIRLSADGRPAGPDILTGGGAPELVVDDGTLLVNVPGSTQGVKVSSDGTTTSFVRFDETLSPSDVDRADEKKDDAAAEDKARRDREQNRSRPPAPDPPRYNPGDGRLPTTTPSSRPAPTVTTTRPPSRRPSAAPTATVNRPEPSASASPSASPTAEPTAAPPAPTPVAVSAPVISAARATGPSSAAVDWTQSGPGAASYTVLVDGASAATVAGGTTAATLTGLATGSSVSVTVRATFADGRTTVSAPAAVTPAGAPGAPRGVTVSETARSRTSATFALSWRAASANGSAVTGYRVSASGAHGSDTWSGSSTSASVTVPCDAAQTSCGSLSVSVTATNGIGTGPAGTGSAAVSPRPGLAMPASGAVVVSGQLSESVDDELDWNRTTTLQLTPPASWSGFQGVCGLRYTTAFTDGPATVPCDATLVAVTSSRVDDGTRRSNHGVYLVAYDPADPGTQVQSATFTWTLVWPIGIDTCGGTTGRICP